MVGTELHGRYLESMGQECCGDGEFEVPSLRAAHCSHLTINSLD